MNPSGRTLYTHQSTVIDRRTLATDFRALAELLRPGMRVLDGGCGTGTITAGIAEAVGPTGLVVGADHNQEFLDRARATYAGMPNLEFRCSPLESLDDRDAFDIVTAARTLQWMPNAAEALAAMTRATKPGGLVVVLDYNHTKIEWQPEPPASMRRFMDAWLAWRSGDRLDNEIADHLPAMFETAGLLDVHVQAQHEPVRKGGPGFVPAAGIWASMPAAFGSQIARANLLSEAEWQQAAREFHEWIAGPGQFQQMYLLACIGRKPAR